VGQAAAGDGNADFLHRLLEQGAVLGLFDSRKLGADQFDAVLFQRSVLRHRHRRVESGLPTKGGEERVGAFLLDDLRQHLRGHRLDVGAVRKIRIGHDGRRVGVEENDRVTLLLQGLAGLGAGIVELAGLADNDRAGADDQDLLYVCTFWHVNSWQ
jgi:hypothetical protein